MLDRCLCHVFDGGWCSRHRLFIRVLNVKSWGGGDEYDMI